MEIDELCYNVFYSLLRNEYRKKYDYALTKCWTICVPITDSLREIDITKEFIDDHVLRPIPESHVHFVSTDENESHTYKIENRKLKLIDGDGNDNTNDDYVEILSVEKGYNKEFQPYNIIIVDKPIHRKYRVIQTVLQSNKIQLNRIISSFKEAKEFLEELINVKNSTYDEMEKEIENIDTKDFSSLEDLKKSLQTLIRDNWASIMRRQTLDVQRDSRFQKLLSVALEIYVMHKLHDNLYYSLRNKFENEDIRIKEKIDDLIDIGVTPDQLGVTESLAVSMPSAMVELATLDSHKSPFEKLMCLKGTLDFIIAEIKGAMADVESRNDSLNDNDATIKTYNLETDDLIPLLLYVIIKCKSQRLFTDLYYIENFIWSISPYDGLSYTLVTFKTALALLEDIKVDELPKRSGKVKTSLEIGDFLQISQTKEANNPLDRQMQSLTKMIEECMQTL